MKDIQKAINDAHEAILREVVPLKGNAMCCCMDLASEHEAKMQVNGVYRVQCNGTKDGGKTCDCRRFMLHHDERKHAEELRRAAIAADIVADIIETLSKLREPIYGGVAVSDDVLRERANAITTVLMNSYTVERMDP